jgi:hypothetical protein
LVKVLKLDRILSIPVVVGEGWHMSLGSTDKERYKLYLEILYFRY